MKFKPPFEKGREKDRPETRQDNRSTGVPTGIPTSKANRGNPIGSIRSGEKTLNFSIELSPEGKERLSAALIAGRTGTFQWNVQTDELEWDDCLGRLFGGDFQATGKILRLSDFIAGVHPADRSRVREACTLCASEGAEFNMEFRVIWPDKTIHWLTNRGRTVRDSQGKFEFLIGVCAEVTERRHYEAQLREQRDILQSIVAGAPLPHILESLTQAVERQAERPITATILLVSSDGTHLVSAAGRSAPAEWIRLIEKVEIGPETGSCGSAVFRRERVVVCDIQEDPRWASLKEQAASFGLRACWSTPIFSADNRVLGTFAIYHPAPAAPTERELHLVDVLAGTAALAIQRKLDEDALRAAHCSLEEHARELRESESRFRTMADNISQFAWMADAQGNIFWFNQRWFDYTGTTLEEMRGWGWKAVHHPDFVAQVEERIQRCWDTGEIWEDTFPLRSKTGGYRWFLSRANPIKNAEGKVVCWFGTNTDVTLERETSLELARTKTELELLNNALEQQVEQRTRRLQETRGELEALSYSIMHEMRAPLRSLQGFARILLEEHLGGLDEQARGYLENIVRSADRMDRMVRDVLNYTQTLRDGLPLEPVAPKVLLSGILESYPQFLEREADICIEGEFPFVEANPAALTQCFSNLLSNAVKFVDAGVRPNVRIRAERRGAEIRIHFKDNGIGIPPEQHERIFDLFQQLNKDPGSTGIGLAIVHKWVTRMGGRVGVESMPGKGSRFWVDLVASNAALL